jgi:uncharacterized damage-inducible protein DinB
MSIWRLGDQKPPTPERVTDDVVMRFDHVYEVDPEKMKRFEQQQMPAWDTKRIVASREEHLDWMHDHFADSVLLAGEESETETTEGAKLLAGEETESKATKTSEGELLTTEELEAEGREEGSGL